MILNLFTLKKGYILVEALFVLLLDSHFFFIGKQCYIPFWYSLLYHPKHSDFQCFGKVGKPKKDSLEKL